MAKYRSGDRVSLTIQQETEEGYVLSNGSNQVMLKTNQQLKLGDQVEVFLYHDQKNQLIATDQIPTVSFSAFDWAEVVRVHTTLGVFVDIGSNIEVLVSTDDLPQHMTAWPIVGDQLYVTLKRDKKDRLLAQPVKESDFEDNWTVRQNHYLIKILRDESSVQAKKELLSFLRMDIAALFTILSGKKNLV